MPTPRPESTPRVIRHDGPCGRRVRCWRPECRARFGELATVEVLATGEWLAYCHGTRWHPRPVEVAA
jgi:hypothetical protein